MKHKKSKEKEKVLTREETAALLHISFPTLRKWTTDGIVNAYYLGARVYYLKSEILNALKRSI